MSEHKIYMERCLGLAELAVAEGESAVGSIVVKDGVIIGEAYEKSKQLNDVTRHAEVLAIIDAVKKHGSCEGATLYSNVEPCILCSYVIRHHKIAEVVFSRHCGDLGGSGPRFPLLTAADMKDWGKPPGVIVWP